MYRRCCAIMLAMNVQETIERMVQEIVTRFHPEQVILFGSQARGDAMGNRCCPSPLYAGDQCVRALAESLLFLLTTKHLFAIIMA